MRQLTTLTLEAGGVAGIVDNLPQPDKAWHITFFDRTVGAGSRHFVNKVRVVLLASMLPATGHDRAAE